jgi:hypothetical protein
MKILRGVLFGSLILLQCTAVLAADGKVKSEFGLGIVLGEPSGLNAQWFWGPKSSVDVTAAWSFNNWFMTVADYQIYNYIGDAPMEWRWYYGLGAYLALPENENGIFGARIPLGIKYHFPHSQLDAWGEVAPALEIVPDTKAQLQGGLGVTLWLW